MAKHLTEFNIHQFRGIKELKLENLNDINIITGDNNVGKTSILETINFLNGVDNLRNLINGTRRASHFSPHELTEFEKLNYLFPVDDESTSTIHYSFLLGTKEYDVNIMKENSFETFSKKEVREKKNYINRVNDSHGDELYDYEKINLTFDMNGEKKSEEFYEFSHTSYKNEPSWNIIDVTYISPFKHTENTLRLSKIFNNPMLYEEMLSVLKEFDPGKLSINVGC